MTLVRAKGLITSWLHVPPEREEEFNDWYNLEHLQQMAALPGFVSARHYMVEGAMPKYLAWYGTVDESIEPSAEVQHVLDNPTPWSQRVRRFCAHRERMNSRLMRDVGTVSVDDTPWLYIVHTDIPDHAKDKT